MKKIKNNSGMTLVETVVALVIAMIIMGILTSGIVTASSWSKEARDTRKDGEMLQNAVSGQDNEKVNETSKNGNKITLVNEENEVDRIELDKDGSTGNQMKEVKYSYGENSLIKVDTDVSEKKGDTDKVIIK